MAPPRSIQTRSALVGSHGEDAVQLAEALALAADLLQPRQITKLRSDGHGLNFLINLETGWSRVIVTSA